METDYEGGTPNCSYRYQTPQGEDTISAYALWIDVSCPWSYSAPTSKLVQGPCTCLAALLSMVGARYAIKFLCRAGLNKELTAGENVD